MTTRTITLRDALKQIGVNQDTGELRVKGTNTPSDQDQKFSLNVNGHTTVSSYEEDVDKWEAGTLAVGSASIEVGHQVSISDVGATFTYTANKDEGVHNLNPFYKFGESGTVESLRTNRLIGDPNQETIYNEGTTNKPASLVGDFYTIDKTVTVSSNVLNWRQRIRAGTTTPTEPVKFSIYEDTDGNDLAKLLIIIWLPISLWDGKSPGDIIEFYYTGVEGKKTPLQIDNGTTYYLSYESDAYFSLYGDATGPQGATVGQNFTVDLLEIGNVEFLTATGVGTLEHTHTAQTHYIADTNLNPIELNIPYNITDPFKVSDSYPWFPVNNFVVNILDDEETVIHTATLTSINKSYYFFYNEDTDTWYYNIEGVGSTVEVASDHVSTTDFPNHPQIPDNKLSPCADCCGMIRYVETEKAATCEICMKTGDNTYAWTAIKTNTW